MKSLAISTSLASAIGTLIMLKVLEFFHFIKWNPIGFSDKFHVFSKTNVYVKWGILFLVVWAVCIVLYYISLLFVKIPVAITSLVIGLLLAIIIEWIILDTHSLERTMKRVSIPFICIVIISTRFIMESAIFHSQDNPLSK